MTFLIHATKARVAAEANWGRWIVRCPRCPSGLQMKPQDPYFCCWDCGAAAEVVWPDEEMRLAIERLLLMRPCEQDQSWEPGETLADLMKENGVLGCFDPLKRLEFDTGLSLLSVDNERIVTDMLPVTHRRELKQVER